MHNNRLNASAAERGRPQPASHRGHQLLARLASLVSVCRPSLLSYLFHFLDLVNPLAGPLAPTALASRLPAFTYSYYLL